MVSQSASRLPIFYEFFFLFFFLLNNPHSFHFPFPRTQVQEARPSSGILQAGVVSLYATYLLVSGLSGETYGDDELNCNPFSKGTQQMATVLGTIFTFVAIAYSASRAATKSNVLVGGIPEVVSAADDSLPLMANEAPPPTSSPTTTTTTTTTSLPAQSSETKPEVPGQTEMKTAPPLTATTPAATTLPSAPVPTASTMTREQELIEIGVLPDTKSKRRHLEEAVASGALPKSALADDEESGVGKHHDDDEEDEDEDEEGGKKAKALSRDDETKKCIYNYSYYHLVFVLAAMYVTMLINGWSTTNEEAGELVSVGHDWASVWVKVVSSWIAVFLYIWTLVAPIIFPYRDWS